MSVGIITKNVRVDKNARDESRRTGFDKIEQVENIGSKKRVYKKIFIIVICGYEIWGSCDVRTALPMCMWSLEPGIYVLSILYVKLRIRMYNFS